MASKTEDLQLVVRAVDQASATLKAIKGELSAIGATSEASAKGVETFGSKITSLGQSIKSGFGAGIGLTISNDIQRGITDLLGQLPKAVEAGNAWAQTVHEIQAETGMTAEQTSQLLAVMKSADVPLENSQRLFAMFGKNLETNTGLLRDLGVATVDASGKQLDAYTIVTNLREQFAKYGASLSETKAAQELFSRSGFSMLQFLQLNNDQFALLAENAQQAGLVISQETVDAAHRFQVELAGLGNTIQGVQTSIFAGLEPTLQSFIDGFTRFVQEHMQQIVSFVVGAANFVMGVIGGLLGIDFGAATLSDKLQQAATGTDTLAGNQQRLQDAVGGAAKGEDALTKSIKAQIAAIDAQIRAIDERDAHRKASTERAKLAADITSAQTSLTDLEGATPYTAGLSSGAATLALQKHDQDVVDARQKLSDAIAALNEFDAQQADDAQKQQLTDQKAALAAQLSAHTSATTAMKANVGGLVGANSDASRKIATEAKAAFDSMSGVAKDWRDKGVAFSGDIKNAIGGVMTALFGAEAGTQRAGMGAQQAASRSGGLVSALAGLGGQFLQLAGAVASVGAQIGGVVNGIAGLMNTFWNALPAPIRSLLQSGIKKELSLELQNAIFSGIFGQVLGNSFSSAYSAYNAATHHQMGGFLPIGSVGTVGEVAAETIISTPRGAIVYPSSSPSSQPTSDGHTHDIYLDGRRVAEAVSARQYQTARTAPRSTRPAGAF